MRSNGNPRAPINVNINPKHTLPVRVNPDSPLASGISHSNTRSAPGSLVISQSEKRGPTTSNDRYIYITPFQPSTSEMDIMDHLSEPKLRGCLEDIRCMKLLSSKRKSESLSFVSFKVAVPAQLFDRFIDSSIWPTTLLIKARG